MIAALGTFSVPFLVRPLGGVFFGVMGDRFGRQKVLSLTIVIMAVSTLCIGLIPSYAQIGIWAPILLLLCKLAQGFQSAANIPVPPFMSLNMRPTVDGVLGSWLDFGSIAGFVLGAGVVVLISTILGEERLLEWGWRLPFFLAAPLGLVGLYLRRAEETPAFQEQLEKMEQEDRDAVQNPPRISIRVILRKFWHAFVVCIGIVLVTNVTYYMLLTYMPSYLSHNLNYSEDHGVLIIIVVMIGMLFVQPVVGFASDRLGRRPFIMAGSIGLFVMALPAFRLIISGNIGFIFLGLLLLAVLLNFLTGVMASTLPAMFPTRIRYSALASAFNVSIIVAGLTPTLAAWLVESTDNLMMPAYYLMAVAVVGFVTALIMKETANRPLRGDTPNASSHAEAKELLQDAYDHIEQRVEDIDAEIKAVRAQLAELEARRRDLVNQHPELE